MRTQEDNKKERKELKDWKKPELEVLDKDNTKGGEEPNTGETFFGSQ